MTTLSDRIKSAMASAGLTQADLARSCGVSSPTVSNWLSGKTKALKASTAVAAASALGVDVAWLESGREHPARSGNISTPPRPIAVVDGNTPLSDDEIEVPRLTLKLSAGSGRLNWEIDEKGARNRFRKSWCEREGLDPTALVTVQIEGESMAPSIPDGASVMLDIREARVRSDEVYAIDYFGEFFIKRLFRMPDGGLLVRSDNPDKNRFPDWVIRPENGDSLRVLGTPVSVTFNWRKRW